MNAADKTGTEPGGTGPGDTEPPVDEYDDDIDAPDAFDLDDDALEELADELDAEGPEEPE